MNENEKNNDAAYRAKWTYAKKNYDSILINVPKGTREQIRNLASANGVSVSRYILEAVEQRSGIKLTLDNALPWTKK